MEGGDKEGGRCCRKGEREEGEKQNGSENEDITELEMRRRGELDGGREEGCKE